VNESFNGIRGGKSIITIACLSDSPVGIVWVAASERGLAAIEIGVNEDSLLATLHHRGLEITAPGSGQAIDIANQALAQIREYLAGERQDFDLPVNWSQLTPFQSLVLREVYAIPFGKVSTYGEIARKLGKPGASRAVGRANATNPIPLVIPCHRVIGQDGSLRGYGTGNGIETKAWLLRLEGRDI
jgi:methylated-DNA-[protein]-cysteine S-methyltransferase